MRLVTMFLGLLFLALCHPSSAQSTTEAVGSASVAPPTTTLSPINDWRDVVYELLRNITLDCKPSNGLEPPTEGFTWTANGTAIEQVSVLQGRYELRSNGAELHVTRASEDDWGTYKCAVDGEGARGFHVTAKPVLRLPPNSNVVEGQKLKLTCRVLGRPYPTVVWKYAPLGINETVDALEFLHERGSVNVSSAGVPGGELVLTAASATDGGNYTCEAPGTGALPAHTILRVKDMYAALWPFLGICAEVFVLCAIILVYEKRRTKPELDDSDTDNHDQKTS